MSTTEFCVYALILGVCISLLLHISYKKDDNKRDVDDEYDNWFNEFS